MKQALLFASILKYLNFFNVFIFMIKFNKMRRYALFVWVMLKFKG